MVEEESTSKQPTAKPKPTATATTFKKKKAGGPAPSASAEGAAPFPDMALCQQMHRLTTTTAKQGGATTATASPELLLLQLQTDVFTKIVTQWENPSLYRWLRHKLYGDAAVPPSAPAAAQVTDDTLLALDAKHETTWNELEAKVEQAKESAGDMEVMEAKLQLARLAAQSLSKTQALQAYQDVIDLPKVSTGKKVDCYMERARLASFYDDTAAADDNIEQALALAEGSGGDWDRRNRLKVYRALQLLLHRDLKKASSLLLDCIATFSCNEMCPYSDFIVYVVLTNLLHLPRPELKRKILDGPEILSVSHDIPIVLTLAKAFYEADYKAYLQAMVELDAHVLWNDRYLQPHAAFWMRELHILAYKQFLDAYQSVTLQAMADAFGVTTDFIDYHASRFIAANRLSAKIDKFGGVIVTNRPDLKNAQYREMIQKGDLLLNRIQKLSRVVDL